jgi:pimeloyl-ACP methyl ester carboxylesterase
VDELLGGGPGEQASRYAQASPAALLPLGVPVRHLVGAHDSIVPPSYLEAHVAVARASGDDATLAILPDAGHFELVAPSAATWPAVPQALLALV